MRDAVTLHVAHPCGRTKVPGVQARQFYKHGKRDRQSRPRAVLASKLRRIHGPDPLKQKGVIL